MHTSRWRKTLHSWALVKAGTALDQARGGLETPFSSVIFSYLILARPALRRSRPSVACLTTSGLAHTADAQALRRWPPPSGLAHTAGAHPYIFPTFTQREEEHSRAGLPDLQVGRRWFIQKPRPCQPRRRRDAVLRLRRPAVYL